MNAAAAYQQIAITTQKPGRVIVMLYEGAICLIKQARVCIQNRDYMKKNTALCRAQDILFELNASLNMELGGDLCKHLRSLYTFIWVNLNRANIKNDIELLDRLTAIMEDLAGAWRQISA
jgi:flagellar protein FliS